MDLEHLSIQFFFQSICILVTAQVNSAYQFANCLSVCGHKISADCMDLLSAVKAFGIVGLATHSSLIMVVFPYPKASEGPPWKQMTFKVYINSS